MDKQQVFGRKIALGLQYIKKVSSSNWPMGFEQFS